ncbi:MAG: hypothetical protein DRN71_03230 [Candidatus Nanohalarchaeota archaeon]|nr:MAG: hypothetical protein DRN71_03230 [Candidatus Nanohaloarchaeota archaeon]
MPETDTQTKEMLEAMQISSLKTFAKNKDIDTRHSKSKDELVCAILPYAQKLPKDIPDLYTSLDTDAKNFINYLLINPGKHTLSKIYGIIFRGNSWSRCNMRSIKKVLSLIVPSGLLFFDPPNLSWKCSDKTDYYKFYIPKEIRDACAIPAVPGVDIAPTSIKSNSQRKILKELLMKKIRSNDKNICAETGLADDIVSATNKGLYHNAQKRYIKDMDDMQSTLKSYILQKQNDTEKKLYSLLQAMPQDKWYSEDDLVKTLKKYKKDSQYGGDDEYKGKYTDIKNTLLESGFIESAQITGKIYLRKHNESRKKPAQTIKQESGGTYHADIKVLNEYEALQILKYFDIEMQDSNKLRLSLSLQKTGHALSRKENITQIRRETKEWFPGIEKLLDNIESKHGNFLIHKNLAIYEVNDLSLLYKMKSRKDVFCLQDKYLFTPKIKKETEERFIRSAGFVIKSVSANEDKDAEAAQK